MFEKSTDPLAEAAWRTAGYVVIDSATIVLGDFDAFLAWRADSSAMPGEDVLDSKLAFFETMDDLDCPVEQALVADQVVAIRVELVSDVADTTGSWVSVGAVVLDSGRCIVVDPRTAFVGPETKVPAQTAASDSDLRAKSGVIVGCVLKMPMGRYQVEVFRSEEHDELGVRLRLPPRSGGGGFDNGQAAILDVRRRTSIPPPRAV